MSLTNHNGGFTKLQKLWDGVKVKPPMSDIDILINADNNTNLKDFTSLPSGPDGFTDPVSGSSLGSVGGGVTSTPLGPEVGVWGTDIISAYGAPARSAADGGKFNLNQSFEGYMDSKGLAAGEDGKWVSSDGSGSFIAGDNVNMYKTAFEKNVNPFTGKDHLFGGDGSIRIDGGKMMIDSPSVWGKDTQMTQAKWNSLRESGALTDAQIAFGETAQGKNYIKGLAKDDVALAKQIEAQKTINGDGFGLKDGMALLGGYMSLKGLQETKRMNNAIIDGANKDRLMVQNQIDSRNKFRKSLASAYA